MIALSPLLALGASSMIVGNRVVFYAAPLLWFGGAFLISSALRFATFTFFQSKPKCLSNSIASTIAVVLSLFIAWQSSPNNYVPRPSFQKPVLEGLATLNSADVDKQAIVATWWDYGHASLYLNGLPTLHDPGLQATPTTYFVAKALLDGDLKRAINTLRFIGTEGHTAINNANSLHELNTTIKTAGSRQAPDIYLVTTNRMKDWIGSISTISLWDIEKGVPTGPSGSPDENPYDFKKLNCRFSGFPDYIMCNIGKLDLRKGYLNKSSSIVGWSHSRNGQLIRQERFDHDAVYALQIIEVDKRLEFFLLHKDLYESTFNQLFHLNNFGNSNDIETSLFYDNYPFIRIHKFKGVSIDGS